MLQYITRGNTSPVGKQKVFFTAHPADFEKYLPIVTKILHGQVNVAIYYDDGKGEKVAWWKEEYEIQLLVVPVTMEFLNEPNVARLQDLEIARSRNIPLLPFSFEYGISQHFSEVVGKYQCLYAGMQARNEKNFYQKLSEYLTRILEPEEIVEKVTQKAFDLNLFISYRKADRAYVNDFVKMMHKTKGLEGISYWYDEDLVPGHDYNDEIDSALRSADLFVLIITPALVEGDNYVKRVEYLNAVKYGKKILPIELVETDRTMLMEGFPGLKDVIWLRDISESFVKLAAEVVQRRNTPRTGIQNYYLGLAYTNGIYVELNYAMGRMFLLLSAEDGYIWAISKLAEIYSGGIGTPYEPKMALEWRGKEMQGREALFQNRPTKDTLLDYLHSIYTYGITLLDAGNLEVAFQCFLQFLKLSEDYGMGSEDMIRVCYEVARLYRAQGKTNLAEQYYNKQIDLLQQCVEVRGSVSHDDARAYFTALLGLGDLHLANGEFLKAEAQYRQAGEVAQKNYELFQDNETLKDLASVSSRVGELYKKYVVATGESEFLTSAREAYLEAAERRNQAFKEIMSVQTLWNLIQDFLEVGHVCYALQDQETARRYFNKATQACSHLRETLPDIPDKQFYTMYAPGIEKAYLRLTELLLVLGREQEATICRNQYETLMEVLNAPE